MRTRKFLSTLIPALPMLLAALLVILVTVIFLTAMRSKAHAQFGGVEQPMFAMLSTPTQSITNNGSVAYYWNFMDLTSNSVVTGWTDRVQQIVFSRVTPASGPVATTNGVLFSYNASDPLYALTNPPLPTFTNAVMGVIVRPIQHTFSNGQLLVGTNASRHWRFDGDGATPFTVARWVDNVTSLSSLFSITNRLVLMHVQSNSLSWFYTNNVISIQSAFAGTLGIYGLAYSPGAPYNNFQGYIDEIIVWTNVTDGRPIVTNYWNYATNYYNNFKQ